MAHRLRWKLAVAVGVLLLPVSWGLYRWRVATPPPIVSGATTTPAEESSADDRYRQLVQGTWEDDYQGKRTMTLRDDGTGTMIVELSGPKAELFAPRLEFDMEWSIGDRRLQMRSTGGQPAIPVKLVLSTIGDLVDQPILQLDEARLVLLDQDGETKYDWRRVSP